MANDLDEQIMVRRIRMEELTRALDKARKDLATLEAAKALIAEGARSEGIGFVGVPTVSEAPQQRSWIDAGMRLFEDGQEHSLRDVADAVQLARITPNEKAISLYISRATAAGKLKRIRKGVYQKS